MEFQRSYFWPLIATVLLIAGGYVLYTVCYSNVNTQGYQKVLDESTQSLRDVKSTTKQQRRAVVKDIWFTRDNMPLHMHLSSTDSEFLLEHVGNKSEAVEKMLGVVCFVQEELFYVLEDGSEVIKDPSENWVLRENPKIIIQETDPRMQPMQRVRHIVADYATYYFQSGLLIAKEVHLSQYILPGHTLSYSIEGKTPLMSGLAESLEISLLSKGLTFNAKKMRANF